MVAHLRVCVRMERTLRTQYGIGWNARVFVCVCQMEFVFIENSRIMPSVHCATHCFQSVYCSSNPQICCVVDPKRWKIKMEKKTEHIIFGSFLSSIGAGCTHCCTEAKAQSLHITNEIRLKSAEVFVVNLFFGIFVLLMSLSLFSGRLKRKKKKKRNISTRPSSLFNCVCIRHLRVYLRCICVRYAENLNFMNRTHH